MMIMKRMAKHRSNILINIFRQQIIESFMVKTCCFKLRTRNSIKGFVRPSVRPSVREHESKSMKTSVLDAFCACEWRTWGVGGALMPLPTRPQRYCDPASLVSFFKT